MAFEWFKAFLGKLLGVATSESAIKQAFQVSTAVTKDMQQNINLWYSMYINRPPWETCDVQSVGLPGAIAREFSNTAMAELEILVSGGARADYINEQLQTMLPGLVPALEIGLALGGVAVRAIPRDGKLYLDYTGAGSFTPTKFGPDGRAESGVFREVKTHGDKQYVRLEYHEFVQEGESRYYVIRNKAYNAGSNGQPNGQEIPLNTVPDWSQLWAETRVDNIDRPLFGYFKPHRENNVEFGSDVGVSIFGGATVGLIRQADEQWGRLIWEYESGERKIFVDGTTADAKTYGSRMFEYGPFGGASGEFFKEFNPEMRDDPLYKGFQRIVQRIEFDTGLAYGDISDPQTVEKTATEIRSSKQRKFVTVTAIQNAYQHTLNDLIYTMDILCSMYGLAPVGNYEVSFAWGDSVLSDPEADRQDKALDLQEVNAGIRNDYEYRMKWFGESEEEAKAKLPGISSLVNEPQDVIE